MLWFRKDAQSLEAFPRRVRSVPRVPRNARNGRGQPIRRVISGRERSSLRRQGRRGAGQSGAGAGPARRVQGRRSASLVEPRAARGCRGSGERRPCEQGVSRGGVRNDDPLVRLRAPGGFGRAARIPSGAPAAPGCRGVPLPNDSWNAGSKGRSASWLVSNHLRSNCSRSGQSICAAQAWVGTRRSHKDWKDRDEVYPAKRFT